ncbi:lysophospholipid acyltransferase family protein [Jannaschia sp. LMIT008]|uniref:lysophospholipid acyltransferase family protein n=1 Tax=Jannaschia maritima TaxID=3032585 RepID=UPI00281187BA|nr:lysophospholipid acyltransferase family protein [Jannaschia sp. LMIT008]
MDLDRLQAGALRGLLRLLRPLPFHARQTVTGQVTEALVRLSPSLRNRALDNLAHVRPDMSMAQRRALTLAAARNVGRSLAAIWFAPDAARACRGEPIHGPGLAVLDRAKAEGRGAIVVSGHYGEWDTIRHLLRERGLEVGALYRPNNNEHYDPIFLAGIEVAGGPIVPRGTKGFRVMLRHVRDGGFMALLPDQAMRDGTPLRFLGRPALTSLNAAELALRYDVPLVPAFAPRIDGRPRVTIQAPIPRTDPATMMQDFNDRLSERVNAHPEQWHWFHRRWKGT